MTEVLDVFPQLFPVNIDVARKTDHTRMSFYFWFEFTFIIVPILT